MELPLDETVEETEAQGADGIPEPLPETQDADRGAETTDDEAPPAPEPVQPDPAGLEAAVAGLDTRLEESHRLLARQTDLVDRLHAENQNLRAGELRNAQLPLLRDLLRLHDDVGRMRDAAEGSDGDTDDLRLVQESLLDILARNGVEPFAPGHGEPFDSRLHAAAGTEPTTDESLDRSVVEIVKGGFRWDSGEVIRVAEVRAYRYRDAAQDAPEN
ncbi:MAG TPA: nucleotide exchange factor GrpE [Solirubrobacterales bacterium]|nr:nucleotide exchange factor GrpE [Solirubrobacterales bacterium]